MPEIVGVLLRIPRDTQGITDEMHCLLHLAELARRWAHEQHDQLSLVPLLQSVGKLHVKYLLQIIRGEIKGDQHCVFEFLDILLDCAKKALSGLLDSQV